MMVTKEIAKESKLLKDILMKRIQAYNDKKERCIQRLLENPTDDNIRKQLTFIHKYEKHINDMHNVIKEIKI